MTRRSEEMRWLLWLVLPSALGLLVFGAFGLVGHLRKIESEALDQARGLAAAEARDLARRVEAPGLVERLPEGFRIALTAEGELRADPALGPIDPAWLASPRAAFLGPAIEEALDAAARLEFTEGRAREALALLETARPKARDGEDEAALDLRRAWCARRARLEAVSAEARDRVLANADASPADRLSALVLAASADPALGADLLALLIRCPDDEARLVVERLRDLAPEVGADLGDQLEARLARRARLRRARALIGAGDRALVEALDDEILIYRPGEGAPETGGGAGVLMGPKTLLETLGLDPSAYLLGASPPAEAVVALPLIALPPERFLLDPEGAPLGFATLALVGIAITFGAGLVLATRAMRREAQASRLRQDFLTSVTHELKTPLASIRLIAEMLETGIVSEPERRDEYHRLLSAETARLSMLIENVLDLGRMERGERSYDRRVVLPAEIAREAAEVFRPVAERDDLELVVTLDGAGRQAQLDSGALVQALLNLLENGRKYASSGRRLELGDELRGERYRLILRDFGPGIAVAELETIFAPFKRGAAQADGRIAGVGLGLHLARRIAEDQGGHLWAEIPADGRGGALFILELPLLATGDDAR